jgi:4-amino-4-deoxy-L-arabinose transferase-like glycosyltransferase
MTTKSSERKYGIILLVIVAIAILFRFNSLETIPHWDFDEGYNMRYSFDLLHGEILWFAIKYTFVPHPPLFFLAYATVIKFLGVGVYTIRLLTASYGVLTTIVLFYAGRELFSPKVGVIASFIYAVSPEVIYWNRIGYANNQFVLLSVLSLYYFQKYSKNPALRNLLLGCLFLCLSVVTEYLGVLTVAAVAFYFYLYHRSKTVPVVVLPFIPTALTFGFMLSYSPNYFLFDLYYQYHRFFSPAKIIVGMFLLLLIWWLFKSKSWKKVSKFYQPVADSLLQDSLVYVAVISLSIFITTSEDDFWNATSFLFLMGFLGLYFKPSFLIAQKRERRLLMLYILSSLMSLIMLSRADHMTIIVYPYIALGLASMLLTIYERNLTELPWVFKRFKLHPSRRFLFAAVFYSLLLMAGFSAYFFLMGEGITKESVDQDMAVASYLDQHSTQDDVVLTYSWMFPLIHTPRVSLITQSLAYEGVPIAYYSGEFPKDRFAFNTSYKKAKFLVGVNETLAWVLNETNATDAVAYLEGWSKTDIGSFVIYQNPSYNST